MTCRRINPMPSNCEEKCKECRATTTNGTNETHLSARAGFVIVVFGSCEGAVASENVLTLQAAKKIAAAAEGEAKKRGATVVIVIVDDGGHLHCSSDWT